MKELDRKSVKILYFLAAPILPSLVMWTPKKGGAFLLLLLACNLLSLLSAYLVAAKLFDSVVIGMAGGLLYAYVPYRFYSLGSKGDYWEGFSWAVLPLIWYVGYGLVRGRKGFFRKLVSGICMSGTGLCVINLPLWVRDGKALLQGQFTLEGRTSLQDGGLYPAHYLMAFWGPGTSVDFADRGMVDSAPVGIGFLLFAGVVGYVWLCLAGRPGGPDGEAAGRKKDACQNRRQEKRSFCNLSLAVGLAAALCSTNVFPWDDLRFSSKLYTLAVLGVQDAARLVGIAACCFWIVSCAALSACLEWKKREEP